MTGVTYINLDEIVVPSKIYKLGNIEVDTAKISAFDSFRLMKYYSGHNTLTNNPDESIDLILSILNTQRTPGSEISEEELLKSGTGAQVVGLLLALGSEALKTYSLSDSGDDSPLRAILKVLKPTKTEPAK